jgi:FtsP/CotA-like multicopper oxidase with cupredoxin domain/peroxiredoxin
LTVSTKSFPTPNADEVGAAQFQLLCYNNQPVGPTIRVRRGTTFHIRVKNDLKDKAPGKHPANQTGINETPFEFCTTNLHTHGLHVSPGARADTAQNISLGDNIFKEIKPGDELTYEYTLGADHQSGTNWYHPHKHGSVAYQLSNGLAGALIVDGRPGDGIADLEDIPEIAGAKEQILVFQLYTFGVDDKKVGRIDAYQPPPSTGTIYNVKPDSNSCSDITIPTPPPSPMQATAINGMLNPVIEIAPGEVQRWRLIQGSWNQNRELTIVENDKAQTPAKDIKFHEIAIDGIATGTMVAKSNSGTDKDPKAYPVTLAPGQRSDVLIQAPLCEDGKDRIYHLMQDLAEDGTDVPKLNYIAQISVKGKPRPMRLPDPRALAKCQPFASIRDEELTTADKDKSGIAKHGLTFFGSDPKFTYTISGKTFTHWDPVEIRVDSAEEWTITASLDSDSGHPFHIHVNPFQVVMKKVSDGKTETCSPMNVWRDTLFIKQGESYTIRSRFRDFLGDSVLHCHILDHEDQGMMMPIRFIPKHNSPNDPFVKVRVNPPEKLKMGSAPAPALKLLDTAGRTCHLDQLKGRNVVLVFFQGAECSHCVEDLQNLVLAARASFGADTELVAVSSREVGDSDKALKVLGVVSSDRFRLLVDEKHKAFRAFGCYKAAALPF